MSIIDYKLVCGDPAPVQAEVKRLLDQGWHPHGAPIAQQYQVIQAMVQYSGDDDSLLS